MEASGNEMVDGEALDTSDETPYGKTIQMWAVAVRIGLGES